MCTSPLAADPNNPTPAEEQGIPGWARVNIGTPNSPASQVFNLELSLGAPATFASGPNPVIGGIATISVVGGGPGWQINPYAITGLVNSPLLGSQAGGQTVNGEPWTGSGCPSFDANSVGCQGQITVTGSIVTDPNGVQVTMVVAVQGASADHLLRSGGLHLGHGECQHAPAEVPAGAGHPAAAGCWSRGTRPGGYPPQEVARPRAIDSNGRPLRGAAVLFSGTSKLEPALTTEHGPVDIFRRSRRHRPDGGETVGPEVDPDRRALGGCNPGPPGAESPSGDAVPAGGQRRGSGRAAWPRRPERRLHPRRHPAGRPAECLRVRAFDQPDSRRARRFGGPLRERGGGLELDQVLDGLALDRALSPIARASCASSTACRMRR